MLKKLAHFFDIRQSPVIFHVRKHGKRRVVPLTFLASVSLAGIVLIAQNGKPAQQPVQETPPQAATPATPAQPFPGKGIPAIPAAPAQPPLPQKPNTTQDTLLIMSPAGGRGLVRGNGLGRAMQITWIWNSTKPHPRGIQFDVNLLKGGGFSRKITTVTPKPDEYLAQMQWEIPSDVPTGSDYTIEVVATDKKDQLLRDVNDTPFAILGESVTITGRFIDKFTKEPMANLHLVNQPPGIFTGPNGEFTYTAKTAYPVSWEGAYSYSPSCYMQGGIYASYSQFIPGPDTGSEVYRTNTFSINSFDFFVNNITEGDSRYYIPILSDRLDLGDVALLPSGSPYIFSDIEISFEMDFADSTNRIEGGGNGGYSLTNGINNQFPLNYETRIILTDKAGNRYTSPWHKAGVENRCKNVVLSFLNNEFKWQPYEIVFTPGGVPEIVGKPLNQSLTAEGGIPPYKWSIITGILPPGLNLDVDKGEIFGTPTTAGSYELLLKVTDSNGVSNARRFPIPVNNP